jgi:hypothetical protein
MEALAVLGLAANIIQLADYTRRVLAATARLLHGQSEKEFRIPGVLNSQHAIDALGDAGASINAINEAYAQECGFIVDRRVASAVKIGRKTINTIGVVELSFSFRDESTHYPLRFHVLQNCPRNLVLGYPFLKYTETLSDAGNYARRVSDQKQTTPFVLRAQANSRPHQHGVFGYPLRKLTETLSKAASCVRRLVSAFVPRRFRYHNILYLGDSIPRFTGTINGCPQEALADTGSKVLLMDEDFARSNGFSIFDTNSYRIRLCFADGSTAYTLGIAKAINWQFGPTDTGTSYPLDFYILKDAPADVILSEDFLLRKTRAFIEHSAYLLDDYKGAKGEKESHIFVINHDKKAQLLDHYNGVKQLLDDIEWSVEQDLRREEDYRINIIQDDDAREAARTTAMLRQQAWDDAHPAVQLVQTGSIATTNQTSTGAPGIGASSSSASSSPSLPPASQQFASGASFPPVAPTGQPGSGVASQLESQPAAQQGNDSMAPPSSHYRERFRKYFHLKQKDSQ